MRVFLRLSTALACCGLFMLTPRCVAEPSAELQSAFTPRIFIDAREASLPYRLMKPIGFDPNAASEKEYPLLLFLHGYGERGSNNLGQLTHLDEFATTSFRRRHPAFVAVPQCPLGEGSLWVQPLEPESVVRHADKPSPPMQMVMGLVDQLIRELPVDTDRIYVAGLSMGGYGTWDLLLRRPNQFAAAAPICGSADTTLADKIAHIPQWVFHGELDQVVGVRHSRSMVAALRQAGGTPIYTEYPGVGHDAWVPTLRSRPTWDWLFAQKRSENNTHRHHD